jgi:hypothetical protein
VLLFGGEKDKSAATIAASAFFIVVVRNWKRGVDLSVEVCADRCEGNGHATTPMKTNARLGIMLRI